MSDNSVIVNTVTTVAQAEPVSERQDVSAGGNSSPQEKEPDVTQEQVVAAVSDITDYVQNISRELQFQVDSDIDTTIITVLDRESGDVIRQIPREEIVRLARYIAENGPDPISGLLVNSDGPN